MLEDKDNNTELRLKMHSLTFLTNNKLFLRIVLDGVKKKRKTLLLATKFAMPNEYSWKV